MNQADTNPRVQVGALSDQTFLRALSASPTTRAFPWSKAEQTNITLFAANHFNVPEKGFINFVATITGVSAFAYYICGCDTFQMDSENIMEKYKQMGNLGAIICHKLRGPVERKALSGPEIVIPALNGTEEIDITLTENQFCEPLGTLVKFGEDKQFFRENLTHEYTKTLFESDIAYKLTVQAHAFQQSCTLAPVTLTGKPAIETQICPEKKLSSFVQIHAGSTRKNNNNQDTTTDTATIVSLDGMIATTVVAGRGVEHTVTNSQSYSALLTAAALETVTHAVLGNGLAGEELQRYFWETVKLLDKDTEFFGDDQTKKNRAVTFGGAVLYLNHDGNRKAFVYGLGNTAVVARSPNTLVHTWHLQGKYRSETGLDHIPASSHLPTLCVEQGQFDSKKHVTAQVFDVGTNVESIQIMTGCEGVFYKAADENGREIGVPEKIACNSYLFAHEQFNVNYFSTNKKSEDDMLHLSIGAQAAFAALPNLRNSCNFK